jgi:hypothetical protein
VPWTIANIHTGRIPTLLLAGAEANNFLSMVPACLLSQYQVRYITGGDIYDYYDSASASINASASFDMNASVGGVGMIPEPESYAMLLAGLGLISMVARRRSRTANTSVS